MSLGGRAAVGRVTEQDRIVWLDVLRAIAILVVLWGHVFLVGMNDPVTVAVWVPQGQAVGATDYLFGPTTLDRNPLGHWGNSLTAWSGLRLGGFGVALFFLVSGFVILRTLDRMRPSEFLLRRALRIFPVSIVAVGLTAAATMLYCAQIGAVQPHSLASVLASALAVNILFHQLPTTPVLWTLTTELLFYLAMAAAAACMHRIGLRTLTGIAALCLATVVLAHLPVVAPWLEARNLALLRYLAELVVYVSYMLIGCVLWRYRAGAAAGPCSLAATIIGALTLCGYGLLEAPDGRHPGVGLMDAALGLVVFGATMALRPAGAWTWPLRRVAEISYPLYLVHVPLAWGALALLAHRSLPPTAAGMLSVAVVLVAAWLLHLIVERPCHRLGQRLTRHPPQVPRQPQSL